MEVKSLSWTAVFIILAVVFVGCYLAGQATSYNTYDSAGRKTGQQKPKTGDAVTGAVTGRSRKRA